MQRIPFPADVPSAPDLRYYRTTLEAFPCEDQPIEECRPPLARRVLTFLAAWSCLFTLSASAVLALSGCDTSPESSAVQAAREDAAAQASRDWVGLQMCKGGAFSWLDDKTLVCHHKAAR